VLTYVNGGHNPPMIFAMEKCLRLEEGGPVVGLSSRRDIRRPAFKWPCGDVMVLLHGRNQRGDEPGRLKKWDEERLRVGKRLFGGGRRSK